jgi:c(7)-type cytochrome triheme protein
VQFEVRVFTYPVDSWFRTISRFVVRLLVCWLAGLGAAQGQWDPLRKDGLHDPKNPALKELQEPSAALSALPPDTAGNMVRWVTAIQAGVIKPRASLKGATPRTLDQDILLNLKGGMPIVLFPHGRHTEWLDCANCHEGLFELKTGSTPLSMNQILHGEQCGLCHGAVSFPLTECNRCHSVPRPARGAVIPPSGPSAVEKRVP